MSAVQFEVSFRSAWFQPVPGEEAATNPGRFGKALAIWLADRLRARGVAIIGIEPEDFGWIVVVARAPGRVWLGCGNTDGSADRWQVFLTVERSWLGKSAPARQIDELVAHLVQIADELPQASEIVCEQRPA